jgi:2-polyprenyl-3-methyl-5-hydroxy-6-metoxy-1,4-benzoquinol methylase
MWHVLEHVHDLHGYVSTIRKLLGEKGKIFIAVPNYTSADAEMYKEKWAAFDVPRHLYHFSPHSMNVLLAKHGLIIKKIKPMWFDSYYVSMLSERYKGGENLVRAVISGTTSNIKSIVNNERSSSLIYIAEKIS